MGTTEQSVQVGEATADPELIGPQTLERIPVAASFVLPLWKEPGRSSGFFLNRLRWTLSKRHGVKRFKLGHAGTLDPFAEGVLVLLGGKATRLQTQYMGHAKVYEAVVRFGATSPSLDPDTEVTERDAGFGLDAAALERVLPEFVGEIAQMPPAYSAKQVDGRRAYDLARKGVEAELRPVTVRVNSIEVLGTTTNTATLRIRCGKGTYIRALARDIAAALGTAGYLGALARTEASGFTRADCVTLGEALGAASIAPDTLP